MAIETRTTAEFIRAAGITMRVEQTNHNPNMDEDRRYQMDHWRVTLKAGRSRVSLVFSKGMGHHGAEPTVVEVLDYLASDATGFENAQGFEDWCSDYGYNIDIDSRKAERTFKAVERQAERLRRLLGESAYNTLLWNVERE